VRKRGKVGRREGRKEGRWEGGKVERKEEALTCQILIQVFEKTTKIHSLF
jgi:hypothetical protein